jgi:tetratricopeptide (TPR) repeat protein
LAKRANEYRKDGRFLEADTILREALRLLRDDHSEDAAEVYSCAASLRLMQWNPRAALEATAEGLACRIVPGGTLSLKLEIKAGIAHRHSGDYGEAIRSFRRGWTGASGDIQANAVYNFILTLLDPEVPERDFNRGTAFFFMWEPILSKYLEPAHMAWMCATIGMRVGSVDLAVATMEGAIDSIHNVGEAVHALLDLADGYAAQGRIDRVEETAAEIGRSFAALGVREGVMVAARMLQDAAERRAAYLIPPLLAALRVSRRA